MRSIFICAALGVTPLTSVFAVRAARPLGGGIAQRSKSELLHCGAQRIALPQPGRLEAIDGEEGRGVEPARCGRPAGVAMVSSVPLNSPLHLGLCKPRVLARDLGTTLSMKQGTSDTRL
jgi:hypothetical protein